MRVDPPKYGEPVHDQHVSYPLFSPAVLERFERLEREVQRLKEKVHHLENPGDYA